MCSATFAVRSSFHGRGSTLCRIQVQVGRIKPELAEARPNGGAIQPEAKNSSKSARVQPNFVGPGPIWVETSTTLVELRKRANLAAVPDTVLEIATEVRYACVLPLRPIRLSKTHFGLHGQSLRRVPLRSVGECATLPELLRGRAHTGARSRACRPHRPPSTARPTRTR